MYDEQTKPKVQLAKAYFGKLEARNGSHDPNLAAPERVQARLDVFQVYQSVLLDVVPDMALSTQNYDVSLAASVARRQKDHDTVPKILADSAGITRNGELLG
jgi:hypothetical protein